MKIFAFMNTFLNLFVEFDARMMRDEDERKRGKKKHNL